MNHLNKNPDAHCRLAREARCVEDPTKLPTEQLRRELGRTIREININKHFGWEWDLLEVQAEWLIYELGGMAGRW